MDEITKLEGFYTELDMCIFINLFLYSMTFEEAEKQAIKDMREARE